MRISSLVVVVILSVASSVSADTFDAGGANEFTIDFVNISGDTNPASGYGIVNNDYRMGTYEITNGQWDKFANIYGTPTGSELDTSVGGTAYDDSPYWTSTNVPINNLSWYEAAQFVNYLNTSTDHSAAYKFTGTQGTSGYTFAVWESGDAGYDADNPYRNSNAFYFLPTEDEWVKAAYWNGTNLQTYASVGDVAPTQSGWRFYADLHVPPSPWDVGSGYEELNGTFDMMGNEWELMESPLASGDYSSGSIRTIRGGSCDDTSTFFARSSARWDIDPYSEFALISFRVASVPEPCSLVLLSVGGLMLRRKRYKR